jgi:HEAT repeat protein
MTIFSVWQDSVVPVRWPTVAAVADILPMLDSEQRREAFEWLLRVTSAPLRARLLEAGSHFLEDEVLIAYLRERHDDVRRNAGLEILKRRESRSFASVVALLADEDDDVVMQAVLVLGHWGGSAALEPLRGVLSHRAVKVVHAAITALATSGDAATVPLIAPFLRAEPWLRFAAIDALAGIATEEACVALDSIAHESPFGEEAAAAALRIRARRAADQDLQWFVAAIGDEEPLVRLACAEFFGRRESIASEPFLERLVADPDPRVSIRAEELLVKRITRLWPNITREGTQR